MRVDAYYIAILWFIAGLIWGNVIRDLFSSPDLKQQVEIYNYGVEQGYYGAVIDSYNWLDTIPDGALPQEFIFLDSLYVNHLITVEDLKDGK